MRDRSGTIDMTKGSITGVILAFAVPIFIGNIFQQLYNVIDTVVIGNVLGDEAIAAIGASSALYSILIGFMSGMSNGISVVLARFFGMGDERQLKRAVFSSYLLTGIVSLIITSAGLLTLEPFLLFLGTPAEIMDMAGSYMRVIVGAALVTMLYNTLSGQLRAIGNSIMPLYALIAASVINGLLDIVFVRYAGMGVTGAALATVISEAVSVIAILLYMAGKCRILHIKREDFCFDPGLIGELFTTGFSMALMLVLTNIGSVAMQGAVNSFGVKIITGHTAARKIHDICMVPFGTICSAAAMFVSQNYGAGELKRIRQGIKAALIIGAVWCAATFTLLLAAGRVMIVGITGTESIQVIDTAYMYLIWNVPFYIILDVLLVMRNGLQGAGRKIIPVCASFIELVGKFAAALVMAPMLGYLGICLIEPITWIVTVPVVAVGFLYVYNQLKRADKEEEGFA